MAEVKENVKKTVVWGQLQWAGHVDSTGCLYEYRGRQHHGQRVEGKEARTE